MTRPWEPLDRVDTPDGPLELRRRGERDFLITLRGRIIMGSAAHRSEDDLARLACAAVANTKRPRVLVSGLGMGFTLRAALDALARDARVVVVERNAVVATWCKGPLASLSASALDDARVTLVVADVTQVIGEVAKRAPAERFDAVLLDMYEGPSPSAIRVGDPLYGPAALRRTHSALTPAGVVAVWSEKPSVAFERVLESAGFRVEKHRGGRGARVHWIYVGLSQ